MVIKLKIKLFSDYFNLQDSLNAVSKNNFFVKNFRHKFDLLEIPRIPINSDTSIFKFYLKIKTFYEDIKYIN